MDFFFFFFNCRLFQPNHRKLLFSPSLLGFHESGIHHSKLNPYETSIGLTCFPVLAGKRGRRSLLELHAVSSQPYENPSSDQAGREGGPSCVQRWSGGSQPSLPVLFQFRFWSSCLPKGVTNPAATCSYSFILFPLRPLPHAKSGNDIGTQFHLWVTAPLWPSRVLAGSKQLGRHFMSPGPISSVLWDHGGGSPSGGRTWKTPPLESPGVRMNCSLSSALPHCGWYQPESREPLVEKWGFLSHYLSWSGWGRS